MPAERSVVRASFTASTGFEFVVVVRPLLNNKAYPSPTVQFPVSLNAVVVAKLTPVPTPTRSVSATGDLERLTPRLPEHRDVRVQLSPAFSEYIVELFSTL